MPPDTSERAEAATRGWLGRAAAVLPRGSGFVLDPARVEPDRRYWLAWKTDRQAVLVPQSPTLARTLRNRLGLGRIGEDDSSRAPGPRPVPGQPDRLRRLVGLDIHPGAPWPLLDRAPESVALLWRTGSAKDVAFYLDIEADTVIAVLKCGWRPAIAARLKRELDLMAELGEGDEPLAPYPLAAGILPEARPFFTLQQFVDGAPVDPATPVGDVAAWLGALARPEVVSPRDLARRLRERAAAADDAAAWHGPIDGLLDRVGGNAELPAAIGHGDLHPENLLRTAKGALVAIDWEDSERDTIGFLDLVRFVLAGAYADRTVVTFRQLFDPPRLRALEDARIGLLPRHAPALGELLALQFAAFYLSQALSYGMATGASPGRMHRILLSEWPL